MRHQESKSCQSWDITLTAFWVPIYYQYRVGSGAEALGIFKDHCVAREAERMRNAFQFVRIQILAAFDRFDFEGCQTARNG